MGHLWINGVLFYLERRSVIWTDLFRLWIKRRNRDGELRRFARSTSRDLLREKDGR